MSVIMDPDNVVIDSVASESIHTMIVGTSPPGAPPDNCSILCPPTASCSGDDFPSLSSFGSSSPSSSISPVSLPSSLAKRLGTCGEFATAYDSSAESSAFEECPEGVDFDDHASDAPSAYREITRDLCSNGATAAFWNPNTSHSPLEMNEDSDASEASSECGLVSRDVYFDGYEAVYRMWFGGDVNPDAPEENGLTPLSLETWFGRTPLSWAASDGYDRVAKLLLGWEDVNPDMPDSAGRTPLLWAVGAGREEVVKLLLERGDVNPDMLDYGGLALFSWAVGHGYEGAVRLLQPREPANPNTA
ncbi:ankyrin repeat-containing domain protein [Tuber borchii]|uniref:Ankyrin repeat-containing domain protein n=1 Tax=Tuber borchii TaxID=42251 RepID=A0A2T6ZAG7_TUBBO|nr:ankyrin repeat-containing domain protein [Tuber borchii]